MTNSLNSSSETHDSPRSIRLSIRGIGHIPSFKNRKRTRVDRKTLKPHNFTDPKHKKRMDRLEDAIVCALFSACPIDESETPLECSKRLRTLLSGLCDDSIREIPCGEWNVEFVAAGAEGIDIEITKLIP